MPDLLDIYSGSDDDAMTNARAQAAALRKDKTLGQLLQMTGDRSVAPIGQQMQADAGHQMQALAGVPQQRLRMALERGQLAKQEMDATKARQEQEDMQSPAARSLLKGALAKFMPKSTISDDTPTRTMQALLPVAEKGFAADQTAQWHAMQTAAMADARRQAASAKADKVKDASDEAETIAQAIHDGTQPPDLKGLYKVGPTVRAKLADKGFDLTRATQDWQAVQRHSATMNGPQQERARQAVANATGQLDNVLELYDQWQKVGPASGFKMFNRAALGAAKQLGGEVGSVATNMEGQVNLLAGELGNALMGGNSPTDHALHMASTLLSGDWDEKTFKKAIETLRRDLKIRHNSMMNSAPAGLSQNSPYAPQPHPGIPEQQPGEVVVTDGTQDAILPPGVPMPPGWRKK